MTKEEEAIKKIKTYMHDYIMGSFDDDGYTRYEISEEEQNFFNNIDKLLNLLKEKDAEIEKLKEENKNTWNLNANMSKRHLEDSSKIKKKDKIIDLMAEWIEKHTKYYDEDGCYCEVEKEVCNKDIKCKDCIKQYFERKAAEED